VSAHIETLRDKVIELEKHLSEVCLKNCDLAFKLGQAEGKLGALAKAVKEMMAWGVELDDERLKYIVAQVYRRDIEVVEAALEASEVKE
jgi:hypothetical protein